MMMVMRPSIVRIGEEIGHRFLIPRGVIAHFSAFADALIGLDMRAGGYFLQVQGNRLCALGAFEGQGTCRFGAHEISTKLDKRQEVRRIISLLWHAVIPIKKAFSGVAA